MKKTQKLLELLPKLDAVQFAGLARVLKVKLLDEVNPDATDPKERYAARGFNDVLEDMLKNFESSNRARRREILQLVSAAARAGDGSDADNT